ncbi:S24 family peptidase [Erwinia amylovora]
MQQRDEMRSAFTLRLEKALARAGEQGYLLAGKNGSVTNKQLVAALSARGCKISEPGVWKWRNGGTLPDAEKMKVLCDLLNVRTEWLAFGVEDKMPAEPDHNVVLAPVQSRQGKTYPLISWISAGAWLEAVEPYCLSEIDVWPGTTETVSDASFWLTVKGDSMTAPSGLSIPEGTLILVDPEKEATNGSLVIAKRESENEATFKRYVRDGEYQYLKPLNPQYRMQPVDNECRIIGVVVEAKLRLG